jgi:nicotinamide riboside transporter PnuC
MSDTANKRIAIAVFVGWLAGISTVVSVLGGYPFWRAFLAVVVSYAALLLTNTRYERLRRSCLKQ